MADNTFVERATRTQDKSQAGIRVLAPCTNPQHPSWRAFFQMCADLQHGEIERLKIQDGLPVLAEVVTRKVKF